MLLGPIEVTFESTSALLEMLVTVIVHVSGLLLPLREVGDLVFLVEVDDELSWDIVAKHEDSIVHRDSTGWLWVRVDIRVLVLIRCGESIHAEWDELPI